jgi:hypothetical protein
MSRLRGRGGGAPRRAFMQRAQLSSPPLACAMLNPSLSCWGSFRTASSSSGVLPCMTPGAGGLLLLLPHSLAGVWLTPLLLPGELAPLLLTCCASRPVRCSCWAATSPAATCAPPAPVRPAGEGRLLPGAEEPAGSCPGEGGFRAARCRRRRSRYSSSLAVSSCRAAAGGGGVCQLAVHSAAWVVATGVCTCCREGWRWRWAGSMKAADL